jgi:hypothetical protein
LVPALVPSGCRFKIDAVGKILLSRLADAAAGEFRILGRIRNSKHRVTELTHSIKIGLPGQFSV